MSAATTAKTCSCGRVYAQAEWLRLACLGAVGARQHGAEWRGTMLANCIKCHSTMAIDYRFFPTGDLEADSIPVAVADGGRPAVSLSSAGAASFSED